MKKIFSKVAVVATIIAGGISAAGCGLGTLKNISGNDLLNIATVLTTEQGGSSTSYSGTAKFQKDYTTTDGSWQYNPKTGVASNTSYAATVTVTGTTPLAMIISSMKKTNTTSSNSAAIALGDITVDGKTYSNVQMTSVTYNNGSIGDVNDEGYVYACTYTLGGKTYTTPTDFSTTPYAYVDGTTNTTTGAMTLNVQLILDDSNKVEITYSGTKK